MAIAYDADTDSGVSAAVTSVTFSHTTGSLSNGIILVSTQWRDTSNTDITITGITYAAAALTKVRADPYIITNRVRTEIWYKVAPASGANNVVVTFTGTADTGSCNAITYSGVDQTYPIMDSAGYVGSTNAPSLSFGIYIDGAFIYDSLYTKTNETVTAGASQTVRMAATPNSNGDVSKASEKASLSVGETTVSWSWTTTDDTAYTAVVLRPSGYSNSALDFNATDGVRSSGSSLTRSFTVPTGSNRLLIVGTTAQDSNHANMPVTGITFNSVALTKVRSDEPAGNVRSEIWYLIAPDQTTANIVVSYTGSLGEVSLTAVSLVGADQSAPAEANNGASGTTTNPSVSVTSSTNGAWFFSILAQEATMRSLNHHRLTTEPLTDQSYENAQGGIRPYKATAGAQTLQYYSDSSTAYAISGVAIKPAAAGGTTLEVNKSETITFSESVGRMLESYVSKSESITFSESVGRMLESYVNKSESITFSESVSRMLESYVNKSESITFSESHSETTSDPQVVVSDSMTFGESVAMLLTSFVSVGDTITFSELISVLNILNVSVSDSAVFSEAISAIVSDPQISVSDSITFSEAVSLLVELLYSISVSETITFTEAVAAYMEANAIASDSMTFTEYVETNPVSYISVTDSATFSESVSALKVYLIEVTDTMTFTDTAQVLKGIIRAKRGLAAVDTKVISFGISDNKAPKFSVERRK